MSSNKSKENSMSTTFNPYASVVMVALINTNKERIMIKHPTEQNHTHHTHGQNKSCWCFKAFHILQYLSYG